MEKGKLKISKNCVSEELGDELIILDLESGLYHSLNKIGSYIWEEIKDKNPSYDNLKKSICVGKSFTTFLCTPLQITFSALPLELRLIRVDINFPSFRSFMSSLFLTFIDFGSLPAP